MPQDDDVLLLAEGLPPLTLLQQVAHAHFWRAHGWPVRDMLIDYYPFRCGDTSECTSNERHK